MEGQLEELLASLSAMLSQLDDATRQRKELEGITEFCQHWFKQADINLAVEIRNSTCPEILVEHIMVVSQQVSHHYSPELRHESWAIADCPNLTFNVLSSYQILGAVKYLGLEEEGLKSLCVL